MTGAIGSDFRHVVVAHLAEGSDHRFFRTGGWLEQEFPPILTEYHPCVSAGEFSILHAIAGDNIRIESQLDELAPRPQREVLTITRTETFERGRVLPEVWLGKEALVRLVLTTEQPLLDIVERGDADGAWTGEEFRKIESQSAAIDIQPGSNCESLPCVVVRCQSKRKTEKRAKEPCDDATEQVLLQRGGCTQRKTRAGLRSSDNLRSMTASCESFDAAW